MQTITVGKKRNVTFFPLDQNGNPNPIGSDGEPLQIVGIPSWFCEPFTRRNRHARSVAGFTLVPAADGLSCDVYADIVGTMAVLHCSADRGDGVIVEGSDNIEAIGGVNPPVVIAALQLQFGPETDAVPPADNTMLGLKLHSA